jgi:hypothetical protein
VALVIAACAGKAGKRARLAGDAGPRAAAAAPDAAPPPVGPIVVDDTRVVDLGWDERAARPGEKELTDAALAALAKEGIGPAAGAPPGGSRARLEAQIGVELTGAPGQETLLYARVALRLRWKDGDTTRTLEARVVGEKKLGAADRKKLPQLARETVFRAIGDAAALVGARDRIRRGDVDAVIAALSHADPDVRDEAYRAVADRQLRQAVPRLVELLKSPDPLIRDAAIGALVELHAQEAVKPLVDMVEFSDLDMMRRIIDAVGSIGGDEARAYLEFVASGHDSPAVRELAREALERMDRRAGGGDAGAEPR